MPKLRLKTQTCRAGEQQTWQSAEASWSLTHCGLTFSPYVFVFCCIHCLNLPTRALRSVWILTRPRPLQNKHMILKKLIDFISLEKLTLQKNWSESTATPSPASSSPTIYTFYLCMTFVIIDEPILMHYYQLKSIVCNSIHCVAHSLGLDKCIMICVHHYWITENSFTAQKSSNSSTLSLPSLSRTLGSHWSLQPPPYCLHHCTFSRMS